MSIDLIHHTGIAASAEKVYRASQPRQHPRVVDDEQTNDLKILWTSKTRHAQPKLVDQ